MGPSVRTTALKINPKKLACFSSPKIDAVLPCIPPRSHHKTTTNSPRFAPRFRSTPLQNTPSTKAFHQSAVKTKKPRKRTKIKPSSDRHALAPSKPSPPPSGPPASPRRPKFPDTIPKILGRREAKSLVQCPPSKDLAPRRGAGQVDAVQDQLEMWDRSVMPSDVLDERKKRRVICDEIPRALSPCH